MIADTDTTVPPQAQPLLRFLVLVLGGAAALFWILVAYASVANALPLAKDVRLGLYTTLTFLGLVWPAMILAICNAAIRAALVLAGLAAVIYAAIGFAYLPQASGTGTGTLPLLLAALLVVLFGTSWLFGRGREPTVAPAFEQVKSRLLALYGVGLGTVLWVSSFAPAIDASSRRTGDGFEIIPVFFGTIYYFVFVLPLAIIVLCGAEQRQETIVRMLLVLTFALTAIFGLPQLFR